MVIVQWILTVVFALFALINLMTVLGGGSILSVLLALVAVALVFPPLHPLIQEKLAWLKSRALRIFLAIVVFVISFSTISSLERLAFDSMAVCRQVNNDTCETSETRVVTQTPQLFVTAQSEDPIEKIALQVFNRDDKDNAVISQELDAADVLKGEQSYVMPIDTSSLEVGSYEISINPVVEEGVLSGTSKQGITVWPKESDVTRRNPGGDLVEVDSFRILKDVEVCTFTLAETEQKKNLDCQESISSLPFNAETIAFEAQIGNPGKKNVNLDYVLRVNEGGKYEILQEKTLSIDPKTGYMTYYLTLPEEGIPTGDYDMVVSMQTQDDKLIRKKFTVTQ